MSTAACQALVEVLPGGRGVVRQWFRGQGRPNNIKSLMRMRAIVRASLGLDGSPENVELSEIADNILREWNIRTGDEYAICDAVHTFIYNNVGYVQDRAGGNERLQWPLETLRRGLGDCDDLEILEAALLGLCGIQDIWFEAAKYFEETEGADHVYGFAKINSPNVLDGVLYHDATALIIEDKPLGWRESRVLETIQVPVFQDEHNTLISTNMSGLLDVFKKVIGIGWKTGATVSQFIPGVGPGLSTLYSAAGVQPFGAGGGGSGGQAEAGKTFEQLAKATVDYFNGIQKSGRAITVDEYNQASAMLSGLAQFVEDYPFSYITSKWNSNDYKPVFEERLRQIKTVALAASSGQTPNAGTGTTITIGNDATTGTGNGTTTNSQGSADDTESFIEKYVPYAILGLLAFLAVKG